MIVLFEKHMEVRDENNTDWVLYDQKIIDIRIVAWKELEDKDAILAQLK